MSKQKEQMMSVRILPNTTSNPPGKLADAEVVFEADAGPLNGLKLIGFAVWERRAGRRNVALLDYVWTTVAGDCCTPRSCCETCSMISFSWKGDRPSDAKGGRIVPQSGHSVETGRSSRATPRTSPAGVPAPRVRSRLQAVRAASRAAPRPPSEVDRARRTPRGPEHGSADATGRRDRQLSSAQRWRSADVRSVRQATRPRMAASS
jgi:hypothetical protein